MLTVLEGDDDLLLLGHPTIVAKLASTSRNQSARSNVAEGGIRWTVASSTAACRANANPDQSVPLLTDSSPPRISAPVCTRSLAVRAPLSKISNLDRKIGQNANSCHPSTLFREFSYSMLPCKQTMALAFQALSSWTKET